MLGRLRQPEYTGENRCLPCTVVNSLVAVVLAGAVAGAVSASGAAGASVALGAGALVLAVSSALIYLRGYLVPGTPTLTKRYFPPWLLGLFGKDPRPPGAVDGEVGAGNEAADESETAAAGVRGEEIDVERVLLDAGAVEPCEDRDDLCLTESFRTAWNAAIETVREGGVDAETVVRKLDLAVSECTIEEHGDGRVLRAGGGDSGADGAAGAAGQRVVGKWPSAAALVADSAAATVLAERYGAWGELGPEAKGQVLSGLRLFLVDCPTGEGSVEFGQETVESCCSTHEVVAVTCTETGERLFEQPVPQ